MNMRYWAFAMKNKTHKLVPFDDIESVFIIGPEMKFNMTSELLESTHVEKRTDDVTTPTGEMNCNCESNFQNMNMGRYGDDWNKPILRQIPVTYPLPTDKEEMSRKKPTKIHIRETAEQKYANKMNRMVNVGRTVKIENDEGTILDCYVKYHIRGSLYLVSVEGTTQEYFVHNKLNKDLWKFWDEDYHTRTGIPNKHAAGPHRSGCCFTINRRRLANKPYCLACEHDTHTMRVIRRIANGGDEQSLIFNPDGSLTTEWTERHREFVERERRRNK